MECHFAGKKQVGRESLTIFVVVTGILMYISTNATAWKFRLGVFI